MSKSDAATAGEQQEQWISDVLADRANLRKDNGELLQSIGRHVKRAEAAEAELATLRAQSVKLKKSLEKLLRYAESQTCAHEETHRGGWNWTICNACGRKWADDEGGFKPFKEPREFTEARRTLEEG